LGGFGFLTDGINQVETTKYNAAMLPKKVAIASAVGKSCCPESTPRTALYPARGKTKKRDKFMG